jgi:uncharacterized membrane protein
MSLGTLIVVGDLILVFLALGSLVGVLEANAVEDRIPHITVLAFSCLFLFLLHNLHKGRYWALVTIQAFLVLGIILWTVFYYNSPGGFAGISFWDFLLGLVVLLAFILYLQRGKVRKFCTGISLKGSGTTGGGLT